MVKLPKLEHVKYVRRRGKVYAYFNTGQKRDGKPIYAKLPPPSAPEFFSSYGSFKAGRTKRKPASYTVRDLVDDYRKSPHFAKRAENTQKLYRVQLARISECWGKFPVNALEPEHVRLVLDNEGWGAGTHNAVLAVLGALYTWARKSGKTRQEPTKDVDRARGGEHQPWPEDVLEAALASDDPIIRLAVHLLYFTGQRIGDVLKMRWGDIRGNMIHVEQQKTGKVVEPPLIAELRAELDGTARQGLTIIHGVNDRQLREKLQAFTRSLGVETVPHGLRKNAVNSLLLAGCTIAEVASITGQTYQVVEHYAAKVNTRTLGQAAMLKFEAKRQAK